MRKWKVFRKFLSVMIAALLILPGAVKIDAAEAYYPIDGEEAVVLNAKIVGETSTNDHTYAKAIWTNGDSVYLMTDSTHKIKTIQLTGAGGVVEATTYTHYETTDTVKVGDKVFAPDQSQGNTKSSHLTVARFSLAEFLTTLGLSGGNTYGIKVISEQGQGHWIEGSLQITIPKAKAVVRKTWVGGPKFEASIDLYKTYNDETIPHTPAVAASFTLTEANPTLTKEVDYTDNLGRIFTYYVEEKNIPEGYAATYSTVEKSFVDGYHVFTMSIENKYTPPLMNIEVTKEWKDAGGPARPTEITFNLYRGQETEPFMTQTANSDSGWKTTFMNLPKTTQEGTEIEYKVLESPVPGYTTTYDGFTVKNTRTEKFNLPVEKIWNDEPGTAMRPSTVTFNLYRNTVKVSEISFGANESWKGEFKDLEKFDENGDLYIYTITEDDVPGYTGDVAGFKVTNTRSGLVNIPVTKVWKDINTNARPDEITINLLRNNEPYKTAQMKPVEGIWAYTFKDEAAFDGNGHPYTFKVEEVVPDGYKGNTVKNENGSFTITNTRVNEITLQGEKIWLDDGTGRPTSISVQLLQNDEPYRSALVTPDQDGKWLFSFSKVPEFNEDGIPYVYTLKELTVSGYQPEIDINEDGTFTITNLRVGKVDISGEKTWLDDGTERPTSITVHLLQNDYPIDSKEVKPNEAGEWLFSFTDLDKFDGMGHPYTYEVEESPVNGYRSTVTLKEDGTFEIENLREGIVDIAGRKVWKDAGPLSRPDFITVNLLQNKKVIASKEVLPGEGGGWSFIFEDLPEFDEKGMPYEYGVSEDLVSGYNGTVTMENGAFVITNVRVNKINITGEKIWLDDNNPDRPDEITIYLRRDGDPYKSQKVTPDEEGNWSFEFLEEPEFDQDGLPYIYTIEEENLPEYKETVVKNENGTYTVTNLLEGIVEVRGEKIWLDNGERETESIRINLLRNGEPVDFRDVTEGEDEKWTFEFTELPEFDGNGKAYTYSIQEVLVEGYQTRILQKDDGSYLVENLRAGTVNVSGTKTWLDNGVRDVESITVNLLRDGLEVDEKILPLGENGEVDFTFENLPAFNEKGIAYDYTITEDEVDGYSTTVDKDGENYFNIKNLRVGTVAVRGEKIWLDNGERETESIRINLLRNDEPIDFRTVTEGEDGKWTFEFTELPEFDGDGIAYTYKIEEAAVEGYTPKVTLLEDGSYLIENLRTGIVNVSGTKTWLDDGTERPESIIINLLQNGEEIDEAVVTPDEGGEWIFSFKELPEFDEKGIAYEYTITEDPVAGYESSVTPNDNGTFTVENLRVGTVEVSGEKIWLDDETDRPESITINLIRDEEIFRTLNVMEVEGTWSFSFTGLPEFDEFGLPYTYSIEEVPVEGYETAITVNEDGIYTVENLRVGTVEISGEKTWFDNGTGRPESITVNLLQNGEEIEELVVTPDEEGSWTYSFGEYDEFDEEGIPYEYSVTEDPVVGYNTNYVPGTYDIQNTREGIVNINGQKTWNDLFGRPVSITVNLLQNGVEIRQQTVTANASGLWLYSFTELPEFTEAGLPYVYSITEDAVPGYTAAITGNSILNRQLRATLRIIKIDDFDFPVEGVVFEVANEEGEVIFTGTTDEDGLLEVILPLNTYTVTEISAPADFIMDEEPKTVLLDEDGEVLELTVVNILEIEDVEPLPLPEEEEELPKTGSANTDYLYGLGFMLILGGAVLLSKKKRITN